MSRAWSVINFKLRDLRDCSVGGNVLCAAIGTWAWTTTFTSHVKYAPSQCCVGQRQETLWGWLAPSLVETHELQAQGETLPQRERLKGIEENVWTSSVLHACNSHIHIHTHTRHMHTCHTHIHITSIYSTHTHHTCYTNMTRMYVTCT